MFDTVPKGAEAGTKTEKSEGSAPAEIKPLPRWLSRSPSSYKKRLFGIQKDAEKPFFLTILGQLNLPA